MAAETPIRWLKTQDVAKQFDLNVKTLQKFALTNSIEVNGCRVLYMGRLAVAWRMESVWRWSPKALERVYAGETEDVGAKEESGLRLVG